MSLLYRTAPRIDQDEPVAGRVRVLASAAIGPLVTGYAAVAALLATVTATAPQAHFTSTGVLSAAVPGWLAAYQVPVEFGPRELGALPLLPTIGLLLLVARTAAGAAERLDLYLPRHATRVVGTVAAAHAVFGLVLALAAGSSPVTAAPLTSLVYPALLAAAAATAGVARRCGLLDAVLDRIDPQAVAGLRAGLFATAALLAAGAAALTVAMLGSTAGIRAAFSTGAPGFGAGVGMVLLCLGYLPNAVIGASGFLAGPGLSLGHVVSTPFGASTAPLPALPLLQVLPQQHAAWWPLVCVVPPLVGALVGRLLRDVHEHRPTRLRAVAVAAVVTAVCWVLLSGVAGGRVGTGALDPLNLRSALLAVAVLGWIAVPAGLLVWFGGPEPANPAWPREPEPEPDTEPATELTSEPDTEPAAEDDDPALPDEHPADDAEQG